jgi:hypothetical protein
MTVGELLSRMDQREIMEWSAHFILKAEEQKDREMTQEAISGAETRRWR